MIDDVQLDALFRQSRTIAFGDGIPPEQPDEARRVSGDELSSWLFKKIKPEADGRPVSIQVWLKGFDIVGDFTAPPAWDGGIATLAFENCRFRDGLTLPATKGLPSFSLFGCVIKEDLDVVGTAITGDLKVMNVEARSASIRVNCAYLFVSGLKCTGGVKLAACEITKCELLGLDAQALAVVGGRFGLLRASVVRLGAALLEPISCEYLRIEGRGKDLGGWTGFPLSIKDCEIRDELVLGGLDGVEIDVSKSHVRGFAHVYQCEPAKLCFQFCKIEGDLRFYDVACPGTIHLFHAAASIFSWTNFRPDDDLSAPARYAERFLAYRCTFGEIEWTRVDVESADFTNCMVGQDVGMDEVRCRLLSFNNATIDRDVAFSGTMLAGVFFKRSRARSLSFDSQKQEEPVARMELNLAGSSFKTLSFESEAFAEKPVAILPPILNLVGCTYESLPRFPPSKDPQQHLAFLKMFAAGGTHPPGVEPQPYFQLARQLRSAGYLSEANQIQYDEREAARKEFLRRRRWLPYVGLTMLWAFIGYGIGTRYFRALWVVLALTIVGTLVLAPVTITDNSTQAWLWRAGASFQEVLPVAKLSPHYTAFFEEKTTNSLTFWQNTYFAFHRLMGWLLASFVAAGLAGLTQRPSSS